MDNCPRCGSPTLNAPGIGPYCPNEGCDVIDNLLQVEVQSFHPSSATRIKETDCASHDGGKHCWHWTGPLAYSGNYKTSVRVTCCHCGAHGRQYYDNRPSGYVEMRDGPLPEEPTEHTSGSES